MQVRVLYFGKLKDLFQKAQEEIELPENATVSQLLDYHRRVAPEQGRLWDVLAVAVNKEYAFPEQSLCPGDEVALLPPVSGGVDRVYVELTRDPISAEKLRESIVSGEDGAIVTFDGVVRNNTRGRQTRYLDYEAYEDMALRLMTELANDALTRFPVRAVTLVHRLGKLEIGETSVLILVASAHRGAAFDACRWVIDTLKKTVPIWKKEYFVDGAVWADGEPFPESIRTQQGAVGS